MIGISDSSVAIQVSSQSVPSTPTCFLDVSCSLVLSPPGTTQSAHEPNFLAASTSYLSILMIRSVTWEAFLRLSIAFTRKNMVTPSCAALLLAGHSRPAQTSDKQVDEPVETGIQVDWHPKTARHLQ